MFLAAVVASASVAGAQGAATASGGGGVIAPGKPKVETAVCLRQCVSGSKATPGAAVAIRGNFLNFVTRIVFRGEDGPIRAGYTDRNAHRVKTIVPEGAVDSRPFVVDSRGIQSNRTANVLEVLPVTAIPREVFPVRGPHVYGDGWGAGRGHMGTDVLADCGVPLASVVAGRVQAKGSDGGMGNYVVIDSRDSANDTVYLHMVRPASVRVGQYLGAGQRVGYVGTTGSSTACHLHFELWIGDWWGGGHAVDSEPYLRQLDAKS